MRNAQIRDEHIDYIRRFIRYDKDTGSMVWAVSNRKRKSGTTAGNLNQKNGYITIRAPLPNGDRWTVLAHRLAWILTHGMIPDGLEIDHIDGNRTNNRIANLRLATRAMNAQNINHKRKGSTSKYIGVSLDAEAAKSKTNKNIWLACITVDRGSINLGRYPTELEAYHAYQTAKRKLHEGSTI